MDEQKLAELFLTIIHDNPEPIEGTILPTPSCPPLPRLRTAVLRENWSSAEEIHKQACAYCQRTAARVQTLAWHPTLVELSGYGRTQQDDVVYHLERDDCKHCQRLRESLAGNRLLRRLSGERLTAFLGTGMAGKVVEVEGGKESRLVQVVAGGREEFVVVGAGEKVKFTGPVVTVFEVRPGELTAEDWPLLRMATKGKEGQEWAARALRGADLDGKVRDALAQMMAPRAVGR